MTGPLVGITSPPTIDHGTGHPALLRRAADFADSYPLDGLALGVGALEAVRWVSALTRSRVALAAHLRATADVMTWLGPVSLRDGALHDEMGVPHVEWDTAVDLARALLGEGSAPC